MKQIMTFLNATKVSLQVGDVTALHKGTLKLNKAPNHFETALKKEIKNPESTFNIKLKLLPNVSKFQVFLKSFNPLLASFGIQTRFGSQKKAIIGRNGRNNRYLCYMYHRLLLAKGNPRLYWKISELLIMRSSVYLVCCIHHSSKDLYRSFTMKRETSLLKRINTLRGHHNPLLQSVREGKIDGATLMDPLIKIYRTYIPKGDGRYRPLGVPTVAWRVFAAMWLLPLNGYFPITKSQHGFVPGRGTLTAWHSVMNFVLPARNIYEIDFKGYFPSVNSSAICGHMETMGVPKGITGFFHDMGLTPPDPETLDPLKADETSNMVKLELDSIGLLRVFTGTATAGFDFSKFEMPSKWLDADTNLSFKERYKGYTLKPLFSLENLQDLVENYVFNIIDEPWRLEDMKRNIHDYYALMFEVYQYESAIAESLAPLDLSLEESPVLSHLQLDHKGEKATPGFEANYKVIKEPVVEGLPQGSSLSPFLSMIYFNHFMTQLAKGFPQIQYVAYADDVIFYSDNDSEFDSFVDSLPTLCEYYGLAVALNKSQISKVSGIWQAPRLKFLGIVYDTINSILYSETRSGRRLVWEFTELTSVVNLITNSKARDINGIVINRRESTGVHTFMYEYLFMKTLTSGPYGFALLHYLVILENMSLFSKKTLKRFMTERISFARNVAKYNHNNATSEFLTLLTYLFSKINFFKRWTYKESTTVTTGVGPGLLEGIYGGLLQSRLYLGSKTLPNFGTPSGTQNFKLFYKTQEKDYTTPGTLAHILRSMLGDDINVFNGSSIATYELVRYVRSLSQGTPYSIGSNAGTSWKAHFQRIRFEAHLGGLVVGNDKAPQGSKVNSN